MENLSPLEKKHTFLIGAYSDAKLGDKMLSDRKFEAARHYSKEAKIPFSEEFYKSKCSEAYHEGIENKVKQCLVQSHIIAMNGDKDYSLELDFALDLAEEINDKAQKQRLIQKIQNVRKPLEKICLNIGIKSKKMEEIKEYAKKGEFGIMSRLIKENQFEINFTEKEKSEFFNLYNFEGRKNKINSLINRAKGYSDELKERSMLNSLEEAKSLSRNISLSCYVSTWILEKQIKCRYLIKMLSQREDQNENL